MTALPTPTRRLRTPFAAVAALFFFNGALFGVWASRIPAFTERLGMSPGLLGTVLLAMAVGAILAFPVSGRMTDARGAAPSSVIFAGVNLIAFLALPFADSTLILAAILCAFGASHGAMDVAMNAFAAEVERHLARPVMSLFHAVWSLGAGTGAMSGYLALRAGLDPLAHFWLAALLLVGGALPLAVLPWTSPRTITAKRPVFAVPHGALLLVGLLAISSSIGEGAMADWSALFLREAAKVTEARAALGYTVFAVAMVGTRLLGHRIVGALGPVGAARFSGTCALIGVLTVTLGTGLAVKLLGFLAFGLGYALIVPLAFSRAANDPDTPQGQAIAAVATLSYGGILIGPPMIGFLAEAIGLRGAFGILGILALATISLAGHLRPPR